MGAKQYTSSFLRNSGLLGFSDRLRYLLQRFSNSGRNRKFKTANPGIPFPPPYYIYETYKLSFREYYEDGLITAGELVSWVSKYRPVSEPVGRWLDWGCGAGRIVRHLPGLLKSTMVFGADYNSRYIRWCSGHLDNINFNVNSVDPPLPFETGFFDVISGLSVLTHLSRLNHGRWISELWRVLNKGGILMLSTQGSTFYHKLIGKEKKEFELGGIVVREKIKQGHRLYSAFQSKNAFLNLVSDNFELLDYAEGKQKEEQDWWILKKKSQNFK